MQKYLQGLTIPIHTANVYTLEVGDRYSKKLVTEEERLRSGAFRGCDQDIAMIARTDGHSE